MKGKRSEMQDTEEPFFLDTLTRGDRQSSTGTLIMNTQDGSDKNDSVLVSVLREAKKKRSKKNTPSGENSDNKIPEVSDKEATEALLVARGEEKGLIDKHEGLSEDSVERYNFIKFLESEELSLYVMDSTQLPGI